jgi:hypothetical protein
MTIYRNLNEAFVLVVPPIEDDGTTKVCLMGLTSDGKSIDFDKPNMMLARSATPQGAIDYGKELADLLALKRA